MDCPIDLTNSFWLGRMSDITNVSDIIIDEGVTDVSSLFHSIANPSEANGESMDPLAD